MPRQDHGPGATLSVPCPRSRPGGLLLQTGKSLGDKQVQSFDFADEEDFPCSLPLASVTHDHRLSDLKTTRSYHLTAREIRSLQQGHSAGLLLEVPGGISFPFPSQLPEAAHILWLSSAPFITKAHSVAASGALTFLPHSCQDPCDALGPRQIIQDHLSIS